MNVPTLIWDGCYDESWRGLIVPDAFAHPAKFARGLVYRIMQHGLSRGWWRQGDTIADPFGGVALGGIIAGYAGLNWIGVELEPRFVEPGNKNLAKHRTNWKILGSGNSVVAKLIQGDSRRFAELVRASAIVTSPPYADGGQGGGGDFHPDPTRHGDNSNGGSLRHGYGDAAGQIGELPRGAIDGVVTSPPYEKSIESRGDGIDWDKACERGHRSAGRGAIADGYGAADGQIGAESAETYWQAMHEVYAQCLLALRPRGVMAVVVKDYVKDRRRVGLCDDTLRLLVHLGFEPVERIRAMLVKETSEACMFTPGGVRTRRTERKSFFRRLAEKKGSPRIDWEEVLVVRSPQARGGQR